MINKVEFENMTFAVIAPINKALIESFAQPAEVNIIKHWVEDVVVAQVKQRIFGRQVLHEEISYPANWKEAFKERWYPECAKNRCPVRYTTKTFDVRELVPSLDIPGHEIFINVEVT